VKPTVVIAAIATTLAVAPLAADAAAPSRTTGGTLSFTDYTPDPAVLLASQALHVVTGRDVTNYCEGGRVPALPQDVNSHPLTLGKRSTLKLTATATGAWGVDVTDTHGRPLATTTTAAATDASNGRLTVRLPSGHYQISSCNLGGSSTASVAYTLTPSH
jgi:hypothetical protein